MSIFSKEIQFFLKNLGEESTVAIVPKTQSCAYPGEVLLFRYSLGVGKGSKAFRILLATEPITKEAKTGNLLLTGFKVPLDAEYTYDELINLYKEKGLEEKEYRTYKLKKIYGPLRKVVSAIVEEE
jgi:hypothetical protein